MSHSNQFVWSVPMGFLGFWGRRAATMVAVAAIFVGPVVADVVFLNNGKIAIGSILGPTGDGVAYTVFGQRMVFGINDIMRTEPDTTVLADIRVEITLKDGSRIHGIIIDFDEEIGIFVDIGFGILTIPVDAISEIVDSAVRTRYSGAAVSFSAGGGAYLPLLNAATYFGPSWTSSIGADISVPVIRGLFAGLSFSVSDADFLPSASVSYLFASVTTEIGMRFMGWRMRKDILGSITPYVLAKGGVSYISMTDPSLYPSTQGNIAALIGISCGLDIAIAKGITLKLDLFGDMILQKSSPFVYSGIGLFLGYEM